MITKLYTVSCDQRFSHAFEDLNGNLTVLVPTSDALRNMSKADNLFWNTRHRLPYFLRLVKSHTHIKTDP